MSQPKQLRALDFYAGVGGWSLGLRLANIDVVASYEIWQPAIDTNIKNNLHEVRKINIRELDVRSLPDNIDIVVGSPPCTQFSFSNRGGAGDLDEGLKDIEKFLEIVAYIKPKYWVMENVPRVASIVRQEIQEGGKLSRFCKLEMIAITINFENLGLPQRRKRCFIGNIDFEKLQSLGELCEHFTLGDVLSSINKAEAEDLLYETTKPRAELSDHDFEVGLDDEEARINRSNKLHHPVYNKMAFPDNMGRSVRTITSTCTRVSRESIVINDHSSGTLRRLTLRERACLQGFPISFEFHASSFDQKMKMIGNAMPPPVAYLIGLTMRDISIDDFAPISTRSPSLHKPAASSPVRGFSSTAKRYNCNRSFRFSIPSLHLGSGVRFELRNIFEGGQVTWKVHFYFGTSKSIQTLTIDSRALQTISTLIDAETYKRTSAQLVHLKNFMARSGASEIQRRWSHKIEHGPSPFDLLDILHQTAIAMIEILRYSNLDCWKIVSAVIRDEHDSKVFDLKGLTKLRDHSLTVLVGLIISSTVNEFRKNRSERQLSASA